MAVERSIYSPLPTKTRFSEWNISRREFLKTSTRIASGAFVAGAIGTGLRYQDEARDMLEGRNAREEFDRYIKDEGFDKIDDQRRKYLLGDIASFSDIQTYEYAPQEPDGLKEIVFSVKEPTYLAVTVEGEYDEVGSLPVVKANFDGLEYVVPILQTRFEKSQTFALKTVPPGEHMIQFQKTTLSDSLPEKGISVSVKTPDNLTPFGQAVLDCLPVIGMQKEFALKDIYNNDAPFFRNGYLYERRSDGKVRIPYFEGRTAEDGGIGEDPKKMDKELGRLFDLDHSVIPTLGSEDALLYELAHQEDKIRSHRILTDVTYRSGVEPRAIQGRFFYHSVPDHGMVKKGLERKNNGDLLHNKVYSLYPDFYSHNNSDIQRERFRVRKLIAVREHRNELEREMEEFESVYHEVFIPENFPEQFDTLAFLREREEELINE